MEIILVFGILVVVLLLFAAGRYPVELVTMGMLVVLIASGILTPAEAFAGFSNDFIWMLAALFIISGALQQNGVLDLIGSRLLRYTKARPAGLTTVIMMTVGFTSAFMNNTTVTAIYLSPVISVGRKLKISASKLLIPVAYASILGGTCTLIGTSTNIAVSGYLVKHGITEIGMFEILPIGATMFLVGTLYMALLGKNLLPDHPQESYTEEFGLREFVSEIIISAGSPLIGQPVFRSGLEAKGFSVLSIIRGSERFIPDEFSRLLEGDVLLVEGNVNNLMDIKNTEGVEIRGDQFGDKDLQGDSIRLAEVLVTPQSDFVNNTLQDARFRHEYGLVVIAIKRHGHAIVEKIGKTTLRVGDTLLVQGDHQRINQHRRKRELHILEDFKPLLYRKKKGGLIIATFLAAIVAALTGLLPVSVSFLAAALLILLSRLISLEKAYDSIDFRLLILIAGMSALGTAMTSSGAATWLSNQIIHSLSSFGLEAIMAGLVVLTVFLTQPMSNAAAAMVVLPVALDVARQLGVDPRPFAIAVMMSASVSLVTPFEPSCLLVFTPGRYRFADFFRTGFLLTVLLMMLLVLMIPLLWHF
jgi:di/tricarboxylate transporter